MLNLLSILLILIILYFTCLNEKNIEHFDEPIDVVYTWVNGNDLNHKNKREKHIVDEKQKYNNMYLSNADTQFFDYDILKYSIRSIEKYLPWVRNIYIVTDNQIPHWFKKNNKTSSRAGSFLGDSKRSFESYNKVFIIDHKDIIPNQYLPTFNSHTIEYNIHNIPNLSNKFIYMNDDMLIGNYMNKDDFIKSGKILFRTKDEYIPLNINYVNNYKFAWINMNNLLNQKYGNENRQFLLHQATICDKNIMKDLIQQYPEEYHKTCSTKFRNKYNVPPIGFSLYHGLYNNQVIHLKDNISNHYFRLNNNINTIQNNLDIINKNKPKMICINDNNSFKPTDKHIQLIRQFLENCYPNKSSCE